MSDNTSIGLIVINALVDNAWGVVEYVYGSLLASWPAQTIVGLYVAGVGYTVLMGHLGERSKQWALSALLLSVLASFSDFNVYADWIAGPIWDATVNVAKLAADGYGAEGGIRGMLATTEATLGKTLAVIDAIEVPSNFLTSAWLYIKIGIVVAIMALLSCAMYLAMVVLLGIAIFSLFMMFAIGGPCLWLVAFKETRHITWAWLRAIANYSLWIFFLGLVGGVGNRFVGIVVNDLTRWDLERDGVFNQLVGANVLLTALSVYMLLKASDWAAAVTGGSSTHTGVVGAIGSMAGGALGSATNALGGVAAGAARWSGGVLANKTVPGAAAYRAFSAMRGLGQVK